MCELNLNKRVNVVLTERGAALLNRYNRYNFISKTDYVCGDIFETQFYKIPEIFGNKAFDIFVKHVKVKDNGYRKNKK